MKRTRWSQQLLAAGIGLAALMPLTSIAQDTTSAIRGKIVDESGMSVSGATVMIRDTRTGAVRTLSSNASGTFQATNLPVGGPYEVLVNDSVKLLVPSIGLGDAYKLSIELPASVAELEQVVVVGERGGTLVDIAAGPAATFSEFELETAVAFDRDIKDAYAIDPRLSIDNPEEGSAVNCVGKHPRFNSITLDGVSQNDRFGLNSNGYSTATGMPFPYDAIKQVAVELAPFDVSYGGFSACNINAVTKSGGNEFHGGAFYEYTDQSLRGDSLTIDGEEVNFDSPDYEETVWGFNFGGPIIKDRLFFFVAYEETEEAAFIGQGYAGSGNGVQRDWLSEADFNRIQTIARDLYDYDPGGQPSDGVQTQEKTLVRLDWNINDRHTLSLIYNGYDGIQDRASDSDSNEFEFANHFYQKGAEVTSSTVRLTSQWTDLFSTELFYNQSEMDDSQVTVGPKDFAEVQIRLDGNTVYLGADDSRQANALSTESRFIKLSANYLWNDHSLTFGYEQEKLDIFNLFVQHARGGEIRFDSIDDFEAGTPARYYYGNAGGTNNPNDAAASFSNTLHTVYAQDEWVIDEYALTLTGGLRYDFFTSDDKPQRNLTFEAANGVVNNENIDGLDLLMPRLGFIWEATDRFTMRGGFGLYSGGNPNVWISNAWSNDGITNVQVSNFYDGETQTLFPGGDSIELSGEGRPGYDPPQDLIDEVLAVDPAAGMGSDSFLVIIDPDYEQPNEWKYALGGTWLFDNGVELNGDILYSVLQDSAYYVDLSQEIVGETTTGMPIYDYTNGRDNYMLTNSGEDAKALTISTTVEKSFDFGLDLLAGYAFTDAEDISPMTSSVAGSNFDNLALLDINNPGAGTSNYEVPHRFTFRASYGHEFFAGYESRVTAYYIVKQGQPQSYVMGSSDLEGDGFFGRHLLYIPDGVSDPNVVFDMPEEDIEAFFDWVEARGYGPGYLERNADHARWSRRLDLRLNQEIPGFVGDLKGNLYVKIYNFLNMIDDEWGHQYDAQFFSVQVVDSSVNDAGQYVYEGFNGGTVTDLLEQSSRWEARLGVEFSF